MANRSLWPDGVEVHQRHLEYDTDQRINDVRGLTTDVTSLGVAFGLRVTVNLINDTRVDMSPGHGYAPTGDVLTVTSGRTNIALADYAVGVRNYICLMYDELYVEPEAHETDGTTKNTKAVVNPRVVVLTESNYNALPQTEPVLTKDAKDRALIVAVVTANGAGVPLTLSSIESAQAFGGALQLETVTPIAGVTILSVDGRTPVGTALAFFSYDPFNRQIYWKTSADDTYPFSSGTKITSSGEYTLISLGGNSARVLVNFSQLPTAHATGTYEVTSLYSQTVSGMSAEDLHHRSMLGTGIPTPTNPHGLTLDDLGSGTSTLIEQHQDMLHADGIYHKSSPGLLECIINTASAPDTIQVTDFAPGDAVYINGKQIVDTSGSTSIQFAPGIAPLSLFGVYINRDGVLSTNLRANFPTGTSLLEGKVQIVNVSDNIGLENRDLKWSVTDGLSFDGGFPTPAQAADTTMRLYSWDGVSYVDVHVRGGSTPLVDQADTISFSALPSSEDKFPLAYVVWSGSATGYFGYGFGAANYPNKVFDRRVRGTTAMSNMQSDLGMVGTATFARELVGNTGIAFVDEGRGDQPSAFDAFAIEFTGSNFNVKVHGGVVYLNGKRMSVPGTILTAAASTSNQIWVDYAGTLNISSSTWTTIVNAAQGKPLVRIARIEADAVGVIDWSEDHREYVSLNKDTAYGVAGLNGDKQLTVTSTSDYAISGQAAGAGSGVKGVGGPTNGAGVSGVAGGSSGHGVYGLSSVTGSGVFGQANTSTSCGVTGGGGAGVGVRGTSSSSANPGVQAENTGGGPAVRAATGSIMARYVDGFKYDTAITKYKYITPNEMRTPSIYAANVDFIGGVSPYLTHKFQPSPPAFEVVCPFSVPVDAVVVSVELLINADTGGTTGPLDIGSVYVVKHTWTGGATSSTISYVNVGGGASTSVNIPTTGRQWLTMPLSVGPHVATDDCHFIVKFTIPNVATGDNIDVYLARVTYAMTKLNVGTM